MNRSTLTCLLCILLPTQPCASAGSADAPASEEGVVQGAAEPLSEDWLQRSRETADEWWRDSRRAMGEAWDSTREYLGHGEPDYFAQLWDRLVPKLEETLRLEDRRAELPERAWLGEDQRSNQEAIDQLLDEAVDVLSSSPLQGYRERIRALRSEIAAAQEDIADYRRRRVSAPEKSLVEKTVADYDRAIAAREADVERLQRELSAIESQFAADLRTIGLEISDEQLQLLLSTVVGDNLIDLGIVFDNVKAITLQIEQLVEESGEDIESARRYYGMYVVLLKSLRQMHLQVEEAIAGRYLPQIDAIVQRTRALSEDTRKLLRVSPEKKELLRANLEAQALTIEAGGVYRQYLSEQAEQIGQARAELDKDIAAAWNTYETVRVSGELLDLVKSSRRLIDSLVDRQVPPLRPFQNLEMRRELERLTTQLRLAQVD